ncbi:MAG: hypothetical protein KA035_00790 [Candidatus Levybacteria bacterium]|nr:hypothetical protein [Candidatus Levybacteria bacterium]
MIKKLVLGLLLVIVLLFCGIFLFEHLYGKKINQGISERSKEFIKSQKTLNNANVAGLLEKDKESLKGKKVEVGTCFSFKMPFKVAFVRTEGACAEYFSLENPRGSITAYEKEGRVGTFEQMEGVSFRRQSKEYTESEKTINGRTHLLFKNTTQGYQMSAFSFDQDTYLVITLTASTLENLDKEFDTMLKSIVFN